MSKSIEKACIKYNNKLYTGFDHGECFKKLDKDNTIIVFSKIEEGFIDNEWNFIDRKQAMIIARENKQLRYEPNKETLISEDLHLDWLNKQKQQIMELEEQLANSIRPKFKIGQEVYYIGFNRIDKDIIKGFGYNSYDNEFIYRFKNEISEHSESSIFTTFDEAESRLKELRGK